MTYRTKECPECGGEITPAMAEGRVARVQGRQVVLPGNLVIPTCARCGSEFRLLSDAVADEIQRAADAAYAHPGS